MHVPEVLYSWRIHPGSTASMETGTKPYTGTSQHHVLSRHLRLTGRDGTHEVRENPLYGHPGMWRVWLREVDPPPLHLCVVAEPEGKGTAGRLEDLRAEDYPGLVVSRHSGEAEAALQEPPLPVPFDDRAVNAAERVRAGAVVDERLVRVDRLDHARECTSGPGGGRRIATHGRGLQRWDYQVPAGQRRFGGRLGRRGSSAYIAGMKRDVAELLRDALELPPEARAALAGSLIDSIDDHVDDGAERAWEMEIGRRLAEVDAGRVTPIPWADVRRRLLAR